MDRGSLQAEEGLGSLLNPGFKNELLASLHRVTSPSDGLPGSGDTVGQGQGPASCISLVASVGPPSALRNVPAAGRHRLVLSLNTPSFLLPKVRKTRSILDIDPEAWPCWNQWAGRPQRRAPGGSR